jgi:hypothetical protein
MESSLGNAVRATCIRLELLTEHEINLDVLIARIRKSSQVSTILVPLILISLEKPMVGILKNTFLALYES